MTEIMVMWYYMGGRGRVDRWLRGDIEAVTSEQPNGFPNEPWGCQEMGPLSPSISLVSNLSSTVLTCVPWSLPCWVQWVHSAHHTTPPDTLSEAKELFQPLDSCFSPAGQGALPIMNMEPEEYPCQVTKEHGCSPNAASQGWAQGG